MPYLTILTAVIIIGIFFFCYEKSKISIKEIPIIAVLAAIAALGRVPFAVIPSMQPTTFVVMVSGFVFGSLPGFIVGAFAALVSNFFLGQGPWTIWQMLAWGLCGATTGILGYFSPKMNILILTIISFLWGFVFGWMMNLWYWVTFVYPLSLESWIAVNIASVWFDFIHGAGNVIFMIIFGKSFITILRFFKSKLEITYDN